MPLISVARLRDGDIGAALEKLLDPMMAQVDLAKKSVLIKPNLVEPLAYTGGQTTNPALVEAIISWCRNAGAEKIAVGEGPTYFQPQSALRDCFTRTGIADAARRQGVPWILFDEDAFRTFTGYSADTPPSFGLSEHAFAWDAVINVPVPKTHYLTTVSICMKNLKGFIRREDKPSFHHCGTAGIHGSVTALNGIIRPALHIVDCTAPTHRNSNFLLAGTDCVAADAVTASMMGVDPGRVGTIERGHMAGLGEKDITRVDITGDDVRDLQMNFEQPAAYLARVFPSVRLMARDACSGCLIPLFAALRRLEDDGAVPREAVGILCGRQAPERAPGPLAVIGQCSREHRGGNAWLGGCPPTKEEVYEFLKKTFLNVS